MLQRKLTEELSVSMLGLGCMGMSEFYGATNLEDSLSVLHDATALGVDFFDTADTYGAGENEALLGQFLKETSADVKIATKFGIVRTPGEYTRSIDNSPTYIERACEQSLIRLGLECIDVYFVHRVNADQPIEETMEALAKLKRAGKIQHIGLCEVSASTLRRAHSVHPVSVVQSEYSIWTRDVEHEVLPVCRELGVGFVAYSPLGRGFLTGAIGKSAQFGQGDFRAGLPRFSAENLSRNQAIVEVIKGIAVEHKCEPSQIALAWVLAQGEDIIPIPGTKRSTYLKENCAAVNIRLDPHDIHQLDLAMVENPVSGARYTEEGMKGVNV